MNSQVLLTDPSNRSGVNTHLIALYLFATPWLLSLQGRWHLSLQVRWHLGTSALGTIAHSFRFFDGVVAHDGALLTV